MRMMNKESFTLYPAIDIRGGKCVRLFKGDYEQETVYGEPLEMAEKWVNQGAQWIHLVDLDGAKQGKPINDAIVGHIAQSVPVPVQIGGGIRSLSQIEAYLNQNVRRVILGTSAIKDPSFVRQALREFPEYIAIGLDARDGFIATEGWLKTSETKVDEVALRLQDQGARTFIFTDISKDGTLSGPNVQATAQLAGTLEQEVIASGGISKLADVLELAKGYQSGMSGCIIGKALYQGIFELDEALAGVQAFIEQEMASREVE